ncbi:MAG: alpha-amylase [Candidatus Cloacimonetes bacterium]|nr:alpha-amylase [Candidatus Cloacimonadota bacterium]
MKKYLKPDWLFTTSIYEVNIRQYTKSGTFKEFEQHLPRLKELGFDLLWFMPIQPIGKINRKGILGSYYSISDYRAINPEFGTMEDFKQLVNKIHKHGMHIIIDWVANHTSHDNVLTQTNPEFYNHNESGNFIAKVKEWTDVIDLNYKNPNLHNYMIDAMKFWLEKTEIDGFRCDVAFMVPLNFWEAATSELKKIKPIVMLAEAEGVQFHKKAFDITYNWTFYHLFNDISVQKKQAIDLIKAISQDMFSYSHYDNVLRLLFITNHDENSWNGTVFERLGDSAEVFSILTYLLPGIPLVYSGQEIGLSKRLSFFEKDEIIWKENRFTKLFKELNILKNSNSFLRNSYNVDSFELIESRNENIISFIRKNGGEQILFIANLSPDFQFVKSLSDFKNFREINDKSTVSDLVKLSGWDYKIYIELR